MEYEGRNRPALCIGGPLDGQWRAEQSEFLEVPIWKELPFVKLDPPPGAIIDEATPAVEIVHYKRYHFGPYADVFVATDLKFDEAMDRLLKYYRPIK